MEIQRSWRLAARWALLIGLAAWAGLAGIGAYGLLDNNEGLYAEIAREMIESGDWITPHLNYLPYLEKPPLLYWALAIAMTLLGQSEWVIRLVPALFFFGTVSAVVWFAVRLRRPRVGWLAGMILVSATGFAVLNRTLLFDVPLTCFLTWSLACLGLWLHSVTGGPSVSRLVRLGFWGCLGMAVLAKALVAPMLMGLIGVTAILVARVPFRTALSLLDPIGIALFLLITVPWHVAILGRESGFASFYFINEHLMRFIDSRVPKDYYTGPCTFYLERVPLYLGIWTVFLPLLFWRRASPSVDILRRYLWVWMLVMFIFFTVSRAKSNYYLMPMVPALALLLASAWDRFAEVRRAKPILICAGMLLVILAVLALALPSLIRLSADVPDIWGYATGWMIAMFLLLSMGVTAVAGAIWCGHNLVAVGLLAAMGTLPLPLSSHVMALCDDGLSQRTVARWILAQPPGQVILYGDYEELSSLPFYLARKLPILNSWSKDLLNAQRARNDPTVFLNGDRLRKMMEKGPVYLVARRGKLPHATAAVEGLGFQVASEFRKVVVLSRMP